MATCKDVTSCRLVILYQNSGETSYLQALRFVLFDLFLRNVCDYNKIIIAALNTTATTTTTTNNNNNNKR